MATETLSRLRCDHCNAVEEYESDEALRLYSYRLSLSNGSDMPYMPRNCDLCKDCVLDLIHNWWRKPRGSLNPSADGDSNG